MSARPATRRRRVATVTLRLPSRTQLLSMVRDVAAGFAQAAGFPGDVAAQIGLAVDEATTNVIEHAYAGAQDQVVEIRLDDRPAELRIEILDTGASVDPRSVPRVDLERYTRERRTGGLGVHLMATIMDSVTFRRSARRNICSMVKGKPRGADA